MNFIPFALTVLMFGANLKAQEKELNFKEILHYQITPESGIYGIHREENSIFTFPGEQTFYVKSVYKPEAKEADLGFGTLHNPYDDSERIPFEAKDKGRRVRSLVRIGERLGFLDSLNRQFAVYHDGKKTWSQPTDIILDLARPPRDAKGEATRAEVSSLRARLTKELSRELQNPDLIAGVTDLPKSWKDRDGSQFVLWLRGTSTPLLTLKCDRDEFKSCVVQRACFLKGLSKTDYPNISSLSRDPKTDTIWLLDKSGPRILKVKGSSCHKLSIEAHLRLPKSLANAQSIFIDEKSNLWVGLREPEGSTSASLFIWEAKSL